MAKYGKWIGAGLGFVMGGPIGALFGFFIGSTFDSTTVITSQQMNDPGQSFRKTLRLWTMFCCRFYRV